MAAPIELFVYGTLRTDAAHPMGELLRDHGEPIGEGTIQARLYLIDDPDEPPGANRYPGAVPSADPADRVEGELHRLYDPDSILPAFDAFEACSPDWPDPHEFLRRRMPVTRTDGRITVAVVYLYTWDVSRAEHIASGRFSAPAADIR